MQALYCQDAVEPQLSGQFQLDKLVTLDQIALNEDSLQIVTSSKRSPFLAGVLSAAIPGAGQFYNDNYIMSGVFFLIDVAAITTAVIYDGKGDDQTDEFEAFAEAHWSANRYATWTINNATRLNPSIDPNDTDLLNVFNNDGSVNWNKLHALESAVSSGGTGTSGTYYSHQLAGYQEQQYYEMIGKYAQFNPGWDDFTEDPNDPFTYTHVRMDPLTDRFEYYSGLRGEANDFYNVASKAVLVVVANHIVSAVHAAITTAKYNRSLEMNVSMEKTSFGFAVDYHPRFNLKFEL